MPCYEITTKLKLPTANCANLDVQDSELNVLRGFGEQIKDLIEIEVKVQLSEIYKGQALFQGGDQYHGLKDLILVDHQLQSSFGLEIVEANAFHIRRPSRNVKSRNKKCMYANNIYLLPEFPELIITKHAEIIK